MRFTKFIFLCGFIIITFSLGGCAQVRPNNIENICSIFYQYPQWYWDAEKSQRKWGVPVSTQMAIIYQESRFSATAKPPRKKLFGIIPWFRPTSAYGYSQSVNGTWRSYQRATSNNASRDQFSAATNFIGWYGYRAYQLAKIPRNDTFKLYLAYHEGIGGYLQHTYRRKLWLIQVARQVAYRAAVYQQQLNRCRNYIPKPRWWNIFL